MSELVEIVAIGLFGEQEDLSLTDAKNHWEHGFGTDEAGRNDFRRHALAALRAIEGAGYEVGPGWQPIETAPRDGTRILAIGGGLSEVEVVDYNAKVGCWNAETVTLDDRDDESDGYNRPTHWRPLPAFDAAPTVGGG